MSYWTLSGDWFVKFPWLLLFFFFQVLSSRFYSSSVWCHLKIFLIVKHLLKGLRMSMYIFFKDLFCTKLKTCLNVNTVYLFIQLQCHEILWPDLTPNVIDINLMQYPADWTRQWILEDLKQWLNPDLNILNESPCCLHQTRVCTSPASLSCWSLARKTTRCPWRPWGWCRGWRGTGCTRGGGRRDSVEQVTWVKAALGNSICIVCVCVGGAAWRLCTGWFIRTRSHLVGLIKLRVAQLWHYTDWSCEKLRIQIFLSL